MSPHLLSIKIIRLLLKSIGETITLIPYLLAYLRMASNNATGADGVKIAVLRKGRASLKFI